MMKQEKTFYDSEADIFSVIYKSGEEAYYREYAPGFVVEFNLNNEVIGIEVQDFSRLFDITTSSFIADSSYDNSVISTGEYINPSYLKYSFNKA